MNIIKVIRDWWYRREIRRIDREILRRRDLMYKRGGYYG